jgi:hypothetical protein
MTGFAVSVNASIGFQFCVSTAGFTPTSITFSRYSSSTGPRHVALGYRTSATGPWFEFALNTATSPSWTAAGATTTVALAPLVAADTALADNAAVCWRIVSVFAPGTSAFVSVAGAAIGSAAVGGLVGLLVPSPVTYR